ncbi:MAG: sugar ABC transporter permease [Anaerolineae bacterium]|nr:sugar ABC transporter permease [Anaerolineae bacterium]
MWLIIPMIYSLIGSLYDWNPYSPEATYVGLGNFAEALTQDPLVGKSLVNVVYYVILTLPLGAALALIVAVMINSLPRLKGLYRVIYFLPVVTSAVAVSVLWRWLYQQRFGLFNQVLNIILVDTLHLDINPNVQWLTSPQIAMPSVAAMVIWQGLGFTMVLFLAGLSSIPQELYEAAKIDGAGAWQRFRGITIPLLQPTMVFVLVTGLIGGMQVFTPMYVMTQGGPVNATKTIVFHLYQKAFTLFRFGYASSLAFILFAIILTLTLIQIRFLRTRWQY